METFEEIVDAIDSKDTNPRNQISHQIERALKEAITTVVEGHGASEVTIKIKARQDQLSRRVCFTGEIKSKTPNPHLRPATLWADGHGRLFEQDPEQSVFDLAPRKIREDEQ